MHQAMKARVFMSGRSQHVTIPAEFRFSSREVFVSRDEHTGNVILSQSPGSWQEVFAALEADPFPEDFLAERNQGMLAKREEL